MGKTARTTARLDNAEAHAHADRIATDEIRTVEASGDYPAGTPADDDDGRITIGLSKLTELLAEMKAPRDVLGSEMVDALNAQGVRLYNAACAMDGGAEGKRSLSYEFQGRVIVRTQGRFLQSMARSMLTQAFYALRQAAREYRRFALLDDTMRLARQTAWQVDRPGAAAEGVAESNWIDGDDRFDPTKAAGDRAVNAMIEALPYTAAAFLFCKHVPGLTDGEPITTKVRLTSQAEPAAKPVTMADRLRAAPAGSAAEFVEAARPAQIAAE